MKCVPVDERADLGERQGRVTRVSERGPHGQWLGGAPPATTNYEKFQTGNPVVRRLLDRFYATLREEVRAVGPQSLLDAGCGEGESLARLDDLVPSATKAVDFNPACVQFTAERIPTAAVSRADVRELPFADAEFELVLCLEVLEHLEEPEVALTELRRVSGGQVIVSVPDEPGFSVGSLLRGNYLGRLGRHPEHLQAWSGRSFRRFLADSGATEIASFRRPFPWLMARIPA